MLQEQRSRCCQSVNDPYSIPLFLGLQKQSKRDLMASEIAGDLKRSRSCQGSPASCCRGAVPARVCQKCVLVDSFWVLTSPSCWLCSGFPEALVVGVPVAWDEKKPCTWSVLVPVCCIGRASEIGGWWWSFLKLTRGFCFLEHLSHTVNCENFQPASVFSSWNGDDEGVCVHLSLVFDFCDLYFMYQSQSEKWRNSLNLCTAQTVTSIWLLCFISYVHANEWIGFENSVLASAYMPYFWEHLAFKLGHAALGQAVS